MKSTDGITIGFIVDALSEVLRITKNITEPPSAILDGINSEYITAVCKLEDRLLILLDVEKKYYQWKRQIVNSLEPVHPKLRKSNYQIFESFYKILIFNWELHTINRKLNPTSHMKNVAKPFS